MAQPINAIGRRKEASARVFLLSTSGSGKITVNGRDYKQYFPNVTYQNRIEQPLKTAEVYGKFDFAVNVRGGGVKGQAEATRLGIARALVKDQADVKPKLKAEKMLTRDPRAVERKKSGRKKARKRFQFSKR